MPTFKAWDVMKVPFPYTERQVRERRPSGLAYCLRRTASVSARTSILIASVAILDGPPVGWLMHERRLARLPRAEQEERALREKRIEA